MGSNDQFRQMRAYFERPLIDSQGGQATVTRYVCQERFTW